jgi:ribosomal protein S12 methylthiotransferase
VPDVPRVGFVSLGCPKALVDSERIVTQLRAEGYAVSSTYQDSDLVIVNTCGFIDEAVQESLDAIGEALTENGKVIVTGCLGAKAGDAGGSLVAQAHPSVLAITGPHALEEVMGHVHTHLPRPHDPFTDLVPEAGIKLTPRHYAYLKISEGCNHRCSFCIIPAMRGDLASVAAGIRTAREAAEKLQHAIEIDGPRLTCSRCGRKGVVLAGPPVVFRHPRELERLCKGGAEEVPF